MSFDGRRPSSEADDGPSAVERLIVAMAIGLSLSIGGWLVMGAAQAADRIVSAWWLCTP